MSSPPPPVRSPPPSSSPPFGPHSAAAALTLPLSPEQRARQMIHRALREAAQQTTPLQHVCVTAYHIHDDLVLYDIIVQAGDNLRWLITRRFAEFDALNYALENSVRNVETLPPFPSKEWRWFVDHYSHEFLSQRQALLDNYVRKILTMSKLRSCSSFLDFLKPNREDLMEEEEEEKRQGEAYQQHLTHAQQQQQQKQHPQSPLHQQHQQQHSSRNSSASRASILASTSMTDGLFEPRSYDDEAESLRRERLASLSASSANGAVEVEPALYSDTSASQTRRTSHSHIYTPEKHTHASASAASSTAATPAATPSAAYPTTSNFYDPLMTVDPLWVSSEVSDVSIPAAQVLRANHVVFQVNIENLAKLSAFSKWTVLKRYEEFYRLDLKIRSEIKKIETSSPSLSEGMAEAQRLLAKLPLLPKRQLKMLTDHLQTRFIEKRRLLLEVYLRKLITIPEICNMDCVLDFLGCN